MTGGTGAGKTALLDAVALARVGRTPGQRRVSELLTLGHTHGEVRLTFAARGEVWRVVRRYGKDAPDPALLMERLDGDGGAVIETLAGEGAAGGRLGEVVGMSFGAFTSAVLLAQGRFAEFLTAQPRDRDAILRELFGVASLEGARQAATSLERVALAEADLRDLFIPETAAFEHPRKGTFARQEQNPLDRIDHPETGYRRTGGQQQQAAPGHGPAKEAAPSGGFGENIGHIAAPHCILPLFHAPAPAHMAGP